MNLESYSPWFLAFWVSLLLGSMTAAQDRDWTSADGRKMQGRLVGFDGTTATFLAKGREVQVAADKLSTADRQFLAEWQAAQPKLATGLVESHPITLRQFANASGYFRGSQAKKAHDYFQKFHDRIAALQPQIDRQPPDQAVAYVQKEHSFLLWVPETYQPAGHFGIYLHLSPSDEASLPGDWKAVLAKHRMILISPHRAGNSHGEWFRAAQALDALATVRAEYRTDVARSVVGGFSGGGYMALWIQVLFPDQFAGAISHGKDFPLKEQAMEGNRVYPAAMPFLNESDWRFLANRPNRWVFLMGDKDPNASLLAHQVEDWKQAGFKPTVITPENLGHKPAPGEKLDEAMSAILGTPAP